MRRLVALGLTIAVVWFVVAGAGIVPAAPRVTALALGFSLIAAALSGALIERFGLPRVTGYLLFGMICGPYILNVITRPMARELQFINGVAVVLIAFIAGLEMNFERLRPRLRSMFQLGGIGMLGLYAGLFVAFWLGWPWLGLGTDVPLMQKAAIVAILTTVVASYSPTVTIALIAESRASGPLSELTLAIVILADLILILVFTLVMQFVRYAFGGTGEIGLFVSLSWEIFGSFAFGAAVGAVFAFYLHYVAREVAVALVAVCAIIAGVGSELHLEPLLAALAAGLVVENIAPPRGDMLKEAVERGALPVLVVFFAAAGASLQLDALATIGWVAVAVSALRMALIWGSMKAGAVYARIDQPIGDMVWMGLVSQAGVTLGLTLIIAGEYPTWGTMVQTLVVSLIALHQLIGPVLFRAALSRAGEIGGMDRGESLIPNP
ncbi:MAG TPA: cation:proton antiporter [Vicinamibacterales bacterium]|nr:cation:proton antiporter [Vicinamibacterales bacterium]